MFPEHAHHAAIHSGRAEGTGNHPWFNTVQVNGFVFSCMAIQSRPHAVARLRVMLLRYEEKARGTDSRWSCRRLVFLLF